MSSRATRMKPSRFWWRLSRDNLAFVWHIIAWVCASVLLHLIRLPDQVLGIAFIVGGFAAIVSLAGAVMLLLASGLSFVVNDDIEAKQTIVGWHMFIVGIGLCLTVWLSLFYWNFSFK